jgi:hypothetical protein
MESSMASLLYKNHRIVISTVPHKFTKRWSWLVVVSWFADDRQKLRPIKNWFQQFDSKEEADMCAIEAAKIWVDNRLERQTPFTKY